MCGKQERSPRAAFLWLYCFVLCGTIALPETIPVPETMSRYVGSSAPAASVIVRRDRVAPFHLPRTIFGTFIEHIGHSVFGGISAQLLDNPSLEPYPATPETITAQFSTSAYRKSTGINLPLPWLPLRNDGRRYAPLSGNAANSETSLLVMGLPGREVGIRQPIYLPIERQQHYRGVIFALASEGPVTLNVSFRRHDEPEITLASTNLNVREQNKWIKIPFRLQLQLAALDPLQLVDFAVSVRNGGRVSLDEIRLYPVDELDGLDPVIVQLAKELNTPLLRYGGNFSSGYHWRDGVGPQDGRPTRLNEAWGSPEYNEFGTDELMDFCSRIGALPQICLNLGSGTPLEAKEWVEYVQGSPASAQGRRRTDNGHRLPYPVGAWELGNELYDDTQLGWYSPQSFAQRYLTFFRAIATVAPRHTPIFANGGEIDTFEKWNSSLLSTAGRELQFITTHLVADMEHTRNASAKHDEILAADLALPVGIGRQIGRLQAQVDSYASTRHRVKVSYSEWMFRSPTGSLLPNYDNMGGAVIAAAWLNMLAQHSDFIPMANMTGLVEFAGIHNRRGRTFVTPQYWTLFLYSKYAGDLVVESVTSAPQYDVHKGQVFAPEIPAVPFLDVLATRDSRNGNLTIFVVNRHPTASMPCEIQVDGFGFSSSPAAKIITLSGTSLHDHNDEEHQNTVRPIESRAKAVNGLIRQILPAGSLSVFVFSRTN